MNLIHPSIDFLIHEIVDLIPEKTQGTYNPNDPTSFSMGESKIGDTTIAYQDVTWGIKIKVQHKNRYTYRLYYDYHDHGLSEHSELPEHFLTDLYQIKKQLIANGNKRKSEAPQYFEDEYPYYS